MPCATEDAVTLVRRLLADLDAERWPEIVAALHPETVRRLHVHLLDDARTRAEFADAWEAPPSVPPAVAAWLEEQRREAREQEPDPLGDGFGVATLAELEALTPPEAVARWMRGRHPAHALRRALARTGQDEAHADAFVADILPRYEIVGALDEAEAEEVHVLVRTHATGNDRSRLGVATVARTEDGCRLLDLTGTPDLFATPSIWMGPAQTREAYEREVAGRIARGFAWPSDEAPAVRASLAGYPGDRRPPASLRIESAEAAATIPFDAAAALANWIVELGLSPPPE